jgi:hypothetical protein
MLRPLALLAAVLLPLTAPLAAHAQCSGANLINALPATEQATLRDAARAVPYPEGNLWRATRGLQTIHIIGTYHFDDPRHAATIAAVTPLIASATALLVEAGPAEESALAERVARDPGVMTITQGPTLPELLPEAEWQALSAAMKARGMPGFMAAKLQPWFLSMMLGIPPCDMARATTGRGLDERLMAEATSRDVPIKALEPYDTLFTLFDGMTQDDQLSMIRSALAMEPQAADLSVTLSDAYFGQESRLIWEFMRKLTLEAPDVDPAQAARDLALMETNLMNDRNRAWIPVISAAAAKGPVVAAFGALHLSGDQGVLNLLVAAGYSIERLSLQTPSNSD